MSIEELDELIRELETNYEKSLYTVTHTFVVRKISDNKLRIVACGFEDDKVLFNRVESDMPDIEIKDLDKLYDLVGDYSCNISYDLVELPYKDLEEFYFICTSVCKGEPIVIYGGTTKTTDLLNKLSVGEYATIILKEEE